MTIIAIYFHIPQCVNTEKGSGMWPNKDTLSNMLETHSSSMAWYQSLGMRWQQTSQWTSVRLSIVLTLILSVLIIRGIFGTVRLLLLPLSPFGLTVLLKGTLPVVHRAVKASTTSEQKRLHLYSWLVSELRVSSRQLKPILFANTLPVIWHMPRSAPSTTVWEPLLKRFQSVNFQ